MDKQVKRLIFGFTFLVILISFWKIPDPVLSTPPTTMSLSSPYSSAVNNVSSGIQIGSNEFSFAYTPENYVVMNFKIFQIKSTNKSLTDVDPDTIMTLTNVTAHRLEVIDMSNAQTYIYAHTDNLVFNVDDNSWSFTSNTTALKDAFTTLPMKDSVYIIVNFTSSAQAGFAVQYIPIIIPHKIVCSFSANFATTLHITNVRALSSYWGSSNNGTVTESMATIAGYSIRQNSDGKEVLKGNLTFSSTYATWHADVDMTGHSGSFIVIIQFKMDGISSISNSSSDPTSDNTFSRPFTITDYLMYLIIGGIVIGAILLFLVIRTAKKTSDSIERKPTEKKGKAIEIVEISKGELKRKRLTAPIKKTVKKVNETNLFNVPTWEVEEDAPSEPSTETSAAVSFGAGASNVATPPVPTNVTLHCGKCNSWYEVDEFIKIDCPKCNIVLNLAMWCPTCKKWFDVEEPGNIKCPNDNTDLKFSK